MWYYSKVVKPYAIPFQTAVGHSQSMHSWRFIFLLYDAALYPRKTETSATPLRKSKNPHIRLDNLFVYEGNHNEREVTETKVTWTEKLLQNITRL
jgi:hypothetical protein